MSTESQQGTAGAAARGRPAAGLGGAPHTTRTPSDQGAALWDFLVSFVAARRTFLAIYRRYERRVVGKAREKGVSRDVLVLPPRELFELFHLQRLKLLRDERLRPVRDLAQRIFADREHEELLDVYCTHIYHELSILSEEHRSVGRFLRIHDRRRYRQLFEEVSGYYPMRLRRLRRLFTATLRRIELLLPEWAEHRVVIRSVYLFGDRLAQQAYGEGREALYRRMYPEGGAVAGNTRAARSFLEAGFVVRAREAAEAAITEAEAILARRPLEPAERESREEAQAHLDRIEMEADAEAPA